MLKLETSSLAKMVATPSRHERGLFTSPSSAEGAMTEEEHNAYIEAVRV